ncbi:MAG: hypothetical protein ACIAQF_09435 [Phycisphaerales bacterium JB065]
MSEQYENQLKQVGESGGHEDTCDFGGDPDPRIGNELAEDEQLVWTGKPDPNIAARYERNGPIIGIGVILFDLVVLGGAVAFTSSPYGWAIVAMIVASSVAFAWREFNRPARARIEAARTLYAITDRRCMIIKLLPNGDSTMESFGPQSLSALRSWKAYPGGDVVFSDSALLRHMGTASGTTGRTDPDGFFAVSDPVEIERLIRETLLDTPPQSADQ